MPNKKAAIKSLRQDKKKHDRNKAAKSELRTLTKKARTLISTEKRKEAEDALKTLESRLSIAAKNNIIKKSNASRCISRLRSQCAKIGAK